MIPGIPRNVRITVVSQLDDAGGASGDGKDIVRDKKTSALEFVLNGHVARARLLKEKARKGSNIPIHSVRLIFSS